VANRQYFGTDGIRGRVGQFPMVPEFLTQLGWAIGQQGGKGSVLIGKDTRLSGYMIEAALIAGLTAAGSSVLVTGPLPTPAVAYLTHQLPNIAMGVMISASHNPYEDNGVKLLASTGYKLPDELEYQIEEILKKPFHCVAPKDFGKVRRLEDAPTQYMAHCCEILPPHQPLKNLHIVLDCAHGATYQVAPHVFQQLGARLTLMGHEPDGININQGVGSTVPEGLQQKVLSVKADLGIAFDGDGDRLLMVDASGGILEGDDILYILAKYGKPTQGVVGTLMTNFALEEALLALGLGFYRAKVGDRYVLEALLSKGWNLGGENSGHIIDLRVSTTGDGIVSALLVLECALRLQKTLPQLLEGFQKCPQVLLNVPVEKRPTTLDHPQLKEALAEVTQILKDQGRVLLRPSGTEPLIRVMVEGHDESQIRSLARQLADTVRHCYGAGNLQKM